MKTKQTKPTAPVDLFPLIQSFAAASYAGEYYRPFAIDSRNFRCIPPETNEWFEVLGYLLDGACELALAGHRDAALQCFSELLPLIECMESGDDIVFAEEYGMWMASTVHDYEEVYDVLVREQKAGAPRPKLAWKHDPEREHRVLYEIIVDAYGEEEQAMGWYYYFIDNLALPITAFARLPVRGKTTTEVVPVKIVDVDPKSETARTLRLCVMEKSSNRVQYISPADIDSVTTGPENLQVINDWLYWHRYELL